MAFSLYAATIPSYQQVLGAVSGLIGTAEAFCAEKGIAPEDIIKARLAEDMLPFAYQVKSTAVHSLGAIEGVRRGVFSPDMTPPPESFAALKARIADTLAALEVILGTGVVVLYNRSLHGPVLLVVTCLLATVGLSAAGTLYGALSRLLEQGWIARHAQEDTAREKQAYRLTAAGRAQLTAEVERMKQLTRAAAARLRESEA